MSFFNSTPIGRIINRFTKDVSSMDKELMFSVSLFMSGTMQLCGTIVTIAIVSPYAIVTFVPVLFVFYFVQVSTGLVFFVCWAFRSMYSWFFVLLFFGALVNAIYLTYLCATEIVPCFFS